MNRNVCLHSCCLILAAGTIAAQPPAFLDATGTSGLETVHGFETGLTNEYRMISAGVAAGDYDDDGWVDLYVVTGDLTANRLYRNLGTGQFEDVAQAAGVDLPDLVNAGPLFFDGDGDGDLDLFVGGFEQGSIRLFRNDGAAGFADVSAGSGIPVSLRAVSATASDYDRDGDLDLFVSQWRYSSFQQLWRNEGDMTFVNATPAAIPIELRNTFTANFSDIDGDRWPDLLVASDFGSSHVLLNQRDGTFDLVTGPEITDENGMGAAIGDPDGDGDLDWFVTSIWEPGTTPDPPWGTSGNRYYRNLGDGTFEDATDEAGLRAGYWGWAACFGDFDNDADLDLFHVNGIQTSGFWGVPSEFDSDPSRLFLNDGTGIFSEASSAAGLIDTGQGRGLVCFDYDRDGDLDLFVANNSQLSKFFLNVSAADSHWLGVDIRRETRAAAVGARLELRVGGVTQVREIRAGSHYASQDPSEAHFGLGAFNTFDRLRVLWPDGLESWHGGGESDRFLRIERIHGDGFEAGTLDGWTVVAPTAD